MLHTHLSSEGHISVMIDGTPSANACGYLHLLEVCKLLQCGNQVVCPEGLNGELEPMQFTFSEPTLGKLHHKMSLLWVNPSSVKLSGEAPIASVLLTSSLLPSSMQPTTKYPCDATTGMTAEIQELLSQAMLNTSVLVPGHATPRRSPSVTLGS